MDAQELGHLLAQDESDWLDFKKKPYWDHNTTGGKRHWRADAIKDMLSFANTPRQTSAFIVMGVDDTPGERKVMGCSHYDEANLRAQVIDKTDYPIRWKLHWVVHEGVQLAVLEIFPQQLRPNTVTAPQSHGGPNLGEIWVREGSKNHHVTPRQYRERHGDPLSGLHPGAIQLVERWTEVFDAHGVPWSRVPHLVGLAPADVMSPAATAASLTPDVLDRTCALFHVSRPWLDGVDGVCQQKYSSLPGASSRSLGNLISSGDPHSKQLHFLASAQPVPDDYGWSCALMLVTDLPGECEIETFAICSHACWRDRWRVLKRLAEVAHDADVHMVGSLLASQDVVRELCSTSDFATRFLATHCRGWRFSQWYPDDTFLG